MPLSNEGVRLVAKVALVAICVLVAAFFRTLVGRERNREFAMLMGTLGGLTFGVLIAAPMWRIMASWIRTGPSSATAPGCMKPSS